MNKRKRRTKKMTGRERERSPNVTSVTVYQKRCKREKERENKEIGN